MKQGTYYKIYNVDLKASPSLPYAILELTYFIANIEMLKKTELKNFYNEGYGWICKRCEKNELEKTKKPGSNYSRLMREGEAESKNPELSNSFMASWSDVNKQILICPRCQVSENTQ